jgi:3-oxoacyl-[acyl-carrier protein] reductase
VVVSPDESGKGRVAIVTGGSRGVGRETVQRLASLGYAVVVNYVHDQRAAEATVDAVLAGRGAAVTIRADVSDPLDVERLFDQTIETFGAVDAVVHAVRGRVVPAALTEVSLVNDMAARRLRNGGAIVNLFSLVAPPVLPGSGEHASIAAAVDALTRLRALELREREITVNAVSLEFDKTCAPGRVAELVTYLLGDEGHGITGHVIRLDDRPAVSADQWSSLGDQW